MNVSDIRKLMEMMAATGTTELEWSTEGDKIRLERRPQPLFGQAEAGADQSAMLAALSQLAARPAAASAPAAVAAEPAAAAAAESAEVPGHVVTSPVVGVYYAAPSPDSDPFIAVGKSVEVGSPLCIIEAMKLMNEVTSAWEGVILEIYVENGQRVEYGQPLCRIGGL
ncbi:MAG: acetyl-CoA carboxylase, biotin carboxyl carrier protein [Firmicutes bacterium]|nr:acetyl-CoA carboxylase, biotin carboxyl carrier protein [Bacillota bacterium]